MTYEEFMTSSGGAKRRRSDAKITIDIFDIASILTQYFRERGFLVSDEELRSSDIVDMFDKTGYYLTIERKNGQVKIRWDSK